MILAMKYKGNGDICQGNAREIYLSDLADTL